MRFFIYVVLLFQICGAKAQDMSASLGMIWVNGGNTKIGSEQGEDNEKPSFETSLAGFWIDVKPVSVADFRKFVRFSRYITTAEKKGFGMGYDSTTKGWKKVENASWLYPDGIAKPTAKPDEPARQISWYDARAYANWIGKRLPSELEWERALQTADKLQLAYVNRDLWQWCENWYFSYTESNYFTEKLNRPKSLRAGSRSKVSRTSMRHFLSPEDCFYNTGFRCVKDR